VQAGHQDFAESALGDFDGASDNFALFGGEAAVAGDDVAQLVGADLVAVGFGVGAGEADGEIGGGAEDPHGRAGQSREQVERAGHQQRPLLGALHRDPLRREFTEDEGEERQDEGDGDDRDGFRAGAEEAEQRQERFGQRHGGGGGGEEPGEGDADLDGGEEPVGVACEFDSASLW
jgi:hypothetical protein